MALTLFNALYRRLSADPTINDFVGNDIYEGISRTTARPFIEITVEKLKDEAIAKKDAQHYTVTIYTESDNDGDLDALSAAVEASLNRQVWTDENVIIVSSLQEDERRSTNTDSGRIEKIFFENEQQFNIIATV